MSQSEWYRAYGAIGIGIGSVVAIAGVILARHYWRELKSQVSDYLETSREKGNE